MAADLGHIEISKPEENAIVSMQARDVSLAQTKERDAQLAAVQGLQIGGN